MSRSDMATFGATSECGVFANAETCCLYFWLPDTASTALDAIAVPRYCVSWSRRHSGFGRASVTTDGIGAILILDVGLTKARRQWDVQRDRVVG